MKYIIFIDSYRELFFFVYIYNELIIFNVEVKQLIFVDDKKKCSLRCIHIQRIKKNSLWGIIPRILLQTILNSDLIKNSQDHEKKI